MCQKSFGHGCLTRYFFRTPGSTRGDSFHTIASVGSNSAVVHYQPEKDSCKSLEQNNIFLIDAWCCEMVRWMGTKDKSEL